MKKRREQREEEKAAMAEELEMIQRERAIAEAVDLEKKEEEVGAGRCVLQHAVCGGAQGWWLGRVPHASSFLPARPFPTLAVCCAHSCSKPTPASLVGLLDFLSATLHFVLTSFPPSVLVAPQFHLEQAKTRSAQRLASGRPKAIDKLAQPLFQFEGTELRAEVGCRTYV